MRFPGFATALLVAARAVSGHSHHHDDEHEKLDVEILQQKWGTDVSDVQS
jgi:hypothetical protein